MGRAMTSLQVFWQWFRNWACWRAGVGLLWTAAVRPMGAEDLETWLRCAVQAAAAAVSRCGADLFCAAGPSS
ncbi:hypothetical protein AB838_20975 [Rhodobacteraceae bacterium (ex Bugula neritina AB1)]|nr:hypothetical protein AB838_20975 [Rhodobacteraceae bacterium (ex Bugula neritina AB1)]